MADAPAPRILVIDDDAWILRMVTSVLEKRGYVVETASDGEDGLTKAIAHPPDLVICDVMMPRKDGWTVVKTLRTRAEFAFVPVIFLSALGSDEDRIRGFRLGADDYLPKPFRFEELDLRVANALRRRTRVESETRASMRGAPESGAVGSGVAGPPAESGVRGTLDQIGLASLLTVLEMERKSGNLLVMREPSDTARLSLRNGRVIRAEIDNKPERGAFAVYTLLSWATGKFVFTGADQEAAVDEIQTSTTHLLIEGARRLDETNRRGD